MTTMKRIWMICLLAAVVPLAATAQKKSAERTDFNAFYDKYNGKTDFTTVEITGEMLKLFSGNGSGKSRTGGPVKTFDGIDRIRMVVSDKPSAAFVEELDRLPGEDFKLMTTVNDGGQHVSFYFREDRKNRLKSEFLMLVHGSKDNLALHIMGEIDIRNISGLSGIKISGMDKLNGLGKK